MFFSPIFFWIMNSWFSEMQLSQVSIQLFNYFKNGFYGMKFQGLSWRCGLIGFLRASFPSLTPGMKCMISGLCSPSLCKEQGFQNHPLGPKGVTSPVEIFLVTAGVTWITANGSQKYYEIIEKIILISYKYLTMVVL